MEHYHQDNQIRTILVKKYFHIELAGNRTRLSSSSAHGAYRSANNVVLKQHVELQISSFTKCTAYLTCIVLQVFSPY